MKYKILVSLFVVLVTKLTLASPYTNESFNDIVTKSKSGGLAIDLKAWDQHVQKIMDHAAQFPPKFDNDQDRARAFKDIVQLSDLVESLVNAPNPNPEILWRVGLLSGLGYNMDIPGMSRTAEAVFQKTLEINPEHVQANFHFGVFLANRGEFKKAQYYLKTALSHGHADAEFSLGLTYLGLGDKPKAIEILNSYQKKNPNKNISRMINAIEGDQVKIKKE